MSWSRFTENIRSSRPPTSRSIYAYKRRFFPAYTLNTLLSMKRPSVKCNRHTSQSPSPTTNPIKNNPITMQLLMFRSKKTQQKSSTVPCNSQVENRQRSPPPPPRTLTQQQTALHRTAHVLLPEEENAVHKIEAQSGGYWSINPPLNLSPLCCFSLKRGYRKQNN